MSIKQILLKSTNKDLWQLILLPIDQTEDKKIINLQRRAANELKKRTPR